MFPQLPKLSQFLVLSPQTGPKTTENVSAAATAPELNEAVVPIHRSSSTSSTESSGGFLKLGFDRS
jgi:hypothetical protein